MSCIRHISRCNANFNSINGKVKTVLPYLILVELKTASAEFVETIIDNEFDLFLLLSAVIFI